ncbi:MAG: DUF5706 domain-containing protein [Bacteroidia bacterium]|nr:DUF5706 domain-containing protein [Bacteroidia bacterium]
MTELELLKHTLSRFDQYYSGVNSKGQFYLAINTFLIGASVASYSLLKDEFALSPTMKWLHGLVVILSFFSILLVLLAINPFLKSGGSGKYTSLLFFGSLASMSEIDVHSFYKATTPETIAEDFRRQVYVLAGGLKKKYTFLQWSGVLLFGEFLLISIIAITLLIK